MRKHEYIFVYLQYVSTCTPDIYAYVTNLVSIHELLANDIFTDAGGGSQVVKLVK